MQSWERDRHRAGVGGSCPVSPGKQSANPKRTEFPTAFKAAKVAISKGSYEGPILAALTPTPQQLERRFKAEQWQKIAALHRSETELDKSSRELIRREQPSANLAGSLTTTKRIVEDPLLRVIRNFEDSITLDTVRNEYLLHSQIHQWFADLSAPKDLDELNDRVYAELFLTPASDPWLGLVPTDRYTALQQEGLSLVE